MTVPGRGPNIKKEWTSFPRQIDWFLKNEKVLHEFTEGPEAYELGGEAPSVELSKPVIEAKGSLHSIFAECGIEGQDGWEFFRILLNAVTKFTHAIFKPVNLVLQHDPFVGQLGHKFLLFAQTACEVMRTWEGLSPDEQCAVPAEVIKYVAVKIRSFEHEYPLAAVAARFCIAWSPMLCRLSEEMAVRYHGSDYWPDFPFVRSVLDGFRGDEAKRLISHILTLTNARGPVRTDKCCLSVQDWAIRNADLNDDLLFSELSEHYRDPYARGFESLRRAGALLSEFTFDIPGAMYRDVVVSYHQNLSLGFAARFTNLFSLLAPVLGVSGAQPMVERAGARLWDTLGTYRWNLREALLTALAMIESWSFGIEIVYRILRRFCESQNARIPSSLCRIEDEPFSESSPEDEGLFVADRAGMEYLSCLKGWSDAHAATFHSFWTMLPDFHRALLRVSPSCFIDAVVVACTYYVEREGYFMEDVVHRFTSVMDSVWDSVNQSTLHFAMVFIEILVLFTDRFRVPLSEVKWFFLELVAFPCYSDAIRIAAPRPPRMGGVLTAIEEWLGRVSSLDDFLSLDRSVVLPAIDRELVCVHFGMPRYQDPGSP
jgi:hypothetical protein